MDVNYRMIKIMELLFAGDGQVSIQYAMDAGGISRRTLLYNVEKINAFFRELDLTNVSVSRGTISWDMAQVDKVRQALAHQQDASYVFSKRERKSIVAIWTAVAGEPVTLDLLAALFDVSRNTVVTEVGELKAELFELGMSLNSFGHNGYRLEGEETTIRYYAMECIYSLTSESVIKLVLDHIDAAVGKLCGREITEEDDKRLYALIAESERQTSLHFNQNSIQEAALYLLLILLRAGSGCGTSLGEELDEQPEYAAAGTILRRMGEMGLHIPQAEQGYVATVLLASKIFDMDRQLGSGGVDLAAFAADLVDTFSAKACVQFENRDELVDHLLLHIRPMYYRLKYKIKVRNVLTEEIKNRYRELFNLTDLAVKTVEKRYGLSIPDDEIAYLSVYIGGWMKRGLSVEGEERPSILIVCSAGVGTSLLLREQLTTLLGVLCRYDIKDEREVTSSDCLEHQLVVTTIDLKYEGKNVIKVNPILTQSQQNKLLSWSAELGGNGGGARVNDLLHIIRQYAAISDEGALTNALLSYLTHGKAEQPPQGADLRRVFPPDQLELADRHMEAAESIHRACRALVEKKIVGERYPDSILETIDMLGLYSEISPGVLLAHGRPEDVTDVGLTLLLLREPVLFPKWDKSIRVIFTLATPDNEAHLGILRDLLRLIQRRDACKRLTDCDFTDAAEAYAFVLREIEQS